MACGVHGVGRWGCPPASSYGVSLVLLRLRDDEDDAGGGPGPARFGQVARQWHAVRRGSLCAGNLVRIMSFLKMTSFSYPHTVLALAGVAACGQHGIV
jgi:hypothetical protein